MSKAKPGFFLGLLDGTFSSSSARTRVGRRTRRRRYLVAGLAAVSALTVVAIGSTGAYFTGQVASASQTGTSSALAGVASLTATKSGSTAGQSTDVAWTAPTLTGSTGTVPTYTVQRNSINSFAPSAGAVTLPTTTSTSLTDSTAGAPIDFRGATQVASLRKAATTDFNQGSFAIIGGQVYRWGSAKKDGTGNFWTADAGSPEFSTGSVVAVPGFPEEVRQLAAGVDHLCGLTITGKVYCVGFNGSGQIGDGTQNGPTTAKLINAGALANKVVTSITAGDKFTCALTTDPIIACWGDNSYGQLGDGTSTMRLSPVAVTMTGVFATFKPTVIGASNYGVCAAKGPNYDSKQEATYPGQNNRVACWGRNNWQQAGISPADTSSHPTPVDVADPNNVFLGVTKISGGHAAYCALTTDPDRSNVACWGGGGLGVLGDGASTITNVPTTLPAAPGGVIKNFTDVVTGYTNACATKGEKFSCWGTNDSGQLGVGSTATGKFSTRDLTALPGLGSGTITSISAGPAFSCATGSNGSLFCWGEGDGYALGQTTSTADSTSPIGVVNNSGRMLPGLTADLLAVNSANEYSAARIGGKYYSWSRLTNGSTSAIPVELTGFPANVTKMAAGYYHVCAIDGSNKVWCAGNADYGKLGSSSATTSNSATQVNDTAGVFTGKRLIDITAWDMGTCALADDGTIGCWGQNDVGQLGSAANSPASSAAPVAVTSSLFTVGSSSKATKITSGWDTICVEAGAAGAKYAACWGSNTDGALGAAGSGSSSAAAVKITDAGNRLVGGIAAFDGGRTTFCAVAASNSFTYCWGRGAEGQLGNGVSTTASSTALLQAFGTAATDVTVGGLNVCATAAAGPYCWGMRDYGAIGNGSTATGFVAATAVVDANGVLAGGSAKTLSGLWASMCMLSSSGSLSCWGNNSLNAIGQQGTNAAVNLANPSYVWVGTDPVAQPVASTSSSCLDGAIKTSATTCSLVPGRSYWYQVRYTVPGADSWVSGLSSVARS